MSAYRECKAAFGLLPFDALGEVSKVLAFGEQKYGRRDWERMVLSWTDNMSSALRHIGAFMMGQDYDPESGLHHMAHASCRMLFALTLALRGKGIDDRSPQYGNV